MSIVARHHGPQPAAVLPRPARRVLLAARRRSSCSCSTRCSSATCRRRRSPRLSPRPTRPMWCFVDSWMFAGIVAITAMTTSLGAFSVFVEDAASGRFRDFLVSPIKRCQLILGYLLSTFVIALIMTLLVLVAEPRLPVLRRRRRDRLPEIAWTLGWITLACLAFAALWAFVASFLRTTGAFSALSTIVGTVIGFLAGAFIAVGSSPKGCATSSTPSRSRSRRCCCAASSPPRRCRPSSAALEAIDALREYYGITAVVGDWEVTVPFVLAMLRLPGDRLHGARGLADPGAHRVAHAQPHATDRGLRTGHPTGLIPLDEWSESLNFSVQCRTLNHMVQQQALDRAFAALSDATRRGILTRLGRGRRRSASSRRPRHDAHRHQEARRRARGGGPRHHREGRARAAGPARHRTSGRRHGMDQLLPATLGAPTRRPRGLLHPQEGTES